MAWSELTTKSESTLEYREDRKGLRRVSVEAAQVGAGACDVGLAWLSAMAARALWAGGSVNAGDVFGGASAMGLLSGVFFVAFIGLRGAYSLAHLSDPGRQIRLVAEGWFFTFFVLAWLAFLIRIYGEVSRVPVTLHFVVGLLLLVVAHVAGARWLGRSVAAGDVSLRRISLVAVGEDHDVERIRRRLVLGGIEVVSSSTISPHLPSTSLPQATTTAVDEVRSALAASKLDGIYLFMPWRDRTVVEAFRSTFGPMPVPLVLFLDRETIALFERPAVRIGDMRGFELQRAPLDHIDRILKRLLDISIAAVALFVLSPLMLMTALAILIETGRPVLFRQTRKGFGARPFHILKYRSMTVQENGAHVPQATKNDRRITPLGRVLRKTSIDELPQLFNVLRGDMSIVGPRPHAVAHDDYYDGLIASYAQRQHVKPGITGWAQVNGHRGETREVGQMSTRVEHDLWYIENWSIWLDVKIILKTSLKLFNDERAY